MSLRGSRSSLSKAFSAFTYALSAIGIFLLIPFIEQNIRPVMNDYFAATFSQYVAFWCSWGFVIVLGFCIFFGSSALLQALVQLAWGKVRPRD